MNVQKGKHAEEIWAAIHLEIISSGLAQLDPSWADISIHPPYSRLYYIADGNGYVESSKQHLTLKKAMSICSRPEPRCNIGAPSR